MKLVFLDFDGPIIPRMSHINPCVSGKLAGGWPSCITALNRITDSTGAKIVVTSMWRCDGLAKVIAYLKEWGVTGEVVGVTPLLDAERGLEIQLYLDAAQDVESFVILDDDKDMAHLIHRLVFTPFAIGLTEADADKAIAMLGAPR